METESEKKTDHMALLTDRDRRLNTVDLLPCPFCGGRGIQRYDNAIYCECVVSCGGSVDFGHFIGNTDKRSIKCRKAVAKSWNRRNDSQNANKGGL